MLQGGAGVGQYDKPSLKTGIISLPPHLVKAVGQLLKEVAVERSKLVRPVSKPVKPEAPPLIKTPLAAGSTTDRYMLHSSQVKVVPGNAVLGKSKQREQQKQHYHKQQQPRLKPKVDHTMPVVSMPKVPPQVIMSTGIQRPPPPLVSSKSHDTSRDSRGSSHSRILQSPTITSSHLPSHHHHTHTHKPSKKVSIDPILLGPSSKSSAAASFIKPPPIRTPPSSLISLSLQLPRAQR